MQIYDGTGIQQSEIGAMTINRGVERKAGAIKQDSLRK